MYVVALGQRKGGVGKTTLAVNIAHEMVRLGRSVVLIDADPQGSALQWAELMNLPFEVHQELSDLRNRAIWVRNVLKAGSDIVLVDLPSGFGQAFDSAVSIADLLVIPCGASSLDINSARQTIKRFQELCAADLSIRSTFVLVPTRVDLGTEEGLQIVDELAELGEVGPAISYDIGFVRSFTAGKAVAALMPGEAADMEIQAVTDFVLQKLPRSK